MTPFAINMTAAVMPETFKRASGRQFVTPRARQQSDKGRDWLDTLEIIEFDGPKGMQRAYRGGDGPRVFFQHGWEADSADLTTLARAAATAGFEVVLIDAPAHGASEGRTATMLDFAAGLGAAARRIGQPFAAIAHSMGLPSTVFAIVEQGLTPSTVVGLGAPDALPANVRFQANGMGLSERAIGLLLNGIEYKLGRPIDRFDIARDVGALPSGPLIVHGLADQIVPPEAAQRLAAAWPKAELALFDGIGHRGVLRDDQVVGRVLTHLAATESAPTG